MNSLVDTSKPITEQNEKLLKIVDALMRRVEQDTNKNGDAYAQFERAVLLEDQVRKRTAELEQALHLLNQSNENLASAMDATESAREDMFNAIEAIEEGFALFDSNDVLVMNNSRFCTALPDIRPKLAPGLMLNDFIDLAANSPHLIPPEGTNRQNWAADRKELHKKPHAVFNIAIDDDQWLQVSTDRTLNGSTVIMQTDVTDIIRTEREERDKLLDDQARMIKATLDHLNQAVAIFDKQSRLIGWNRSLNSLLSLKSKSLRMGVGFTRVVDNLRSSFGAENLKVMQILNNWVESPNVRRPLSFEVTSKSGQILDAFVRRMPDGGFVISLTDVSAERSATRMLARANETLELRVEERTDNLQQALQSAERANASKNRFVAAASHDLLQPLSAAKLYLAALSDKANQEILAKAEQALLSVETIIEDLLEISKLDSGSASLEVGNFRLSDILTTLKNEFQPIAALKNLELVVVNSSVTVRSDPSYLRRILQNLISNAIRYTDQGRILVGARRNGGSLRLEVWDTGRGISEPDQAIIFDEFQRLETRASASEGMGLGLAIVERACEQLGHPLQLWSVLGKGSGFFVNVPISDQIQSNPTTQNSKYSPRNSLQNQGLIVLLVENDQELRRAMVLLLNKWDINVLDVASAPEALDLLDEIQIMPDAMVIDYQLDYGDDGINLAQTILQKHNDIPTRIISANRSGELRRKCKEAGLQLMLKPVDADVLEQFLLTAIKPPIA
ncbi:hypothetical protein BFP76_05350 [Amylibacter kogurei]|uniref:histidine kinase n=1 Tax=Paramylibacter kogurei TaxID=1889778 RepID=A0A2G5K672_9RHOB|nr:PAS-domain containing protein [Amylibacter kogurei]PIB24609.1 hypothetical protein BFP76_05350 [Amylibacter kogurei]